MAKALTWSMINMYTGMIDKEFQPIISALEQRNHTLERNMEIEVKKDLGIYEMFMEQEAVELRREELKSALKKFTEQRHHDGRYESRIDQEVRKRLRSLNTTLKDAEEAKEAVIKKVKLMAAGDDVKGLFDELGGEIKKLTTLVASLPPVVEKPMKRLTGRQKFD